MIMRLFTVFALAGVLAPVLAVAQAVAKELDLPAQSRQLTDRVSPMDSYAMPVGPFAAGAIAVRSFEGRIKQQSWRLDGAVVTTLQVMAPLREQLLADGYKILLDCRDLACGGFDFRFATRIIPAPGMHVNIRDYRFLSAVRGKDEALSLLVSRAGNAVYIQAIQAAPQDSGQLRIGPKPRPGPPGQVYDISKALLGEGYLVLGDLVFQSGSAQLGQGPYASLQQLAGFLLQNPQYRIALVGHTDAAGSLSDSISLSKDRAAAVRDRMTNNHDISPDRIDAQGVGYLSPVASSLSVAGRQANQRVEVILLPN